MPGVGGGLVGTRAARDGGRVDRRRFVISSQPIWRLHGAAVARALQGAEAILMPDGERAKTLHTVATLMHDALIKGGGDRDAVVGGDRGRRRRALDMSAGRPGIAPAHVGAAGPGRCRDVMRWPLAAGRSRRRAHDGDRRDAPRHCCDRARAAAPPRAITHTQRPSSPSRPPRPAATSNTMVVEFRRFATRSRCRRFVGPLRALARILG